MAKSNLALAPRSSGKGSADGKTFRIPISTGIFEHCPDMLDSVWLFLWYVDKTTKEINGEGFVLGGVPINDSKPAGALRVPLKKVRKWRLHLVREGYTRALRTPYGHVITLLKSKKWSWGPALVTEKPDPSKRDFPNREISTAKENAHSGHSDLPNLAVRVPKSGSQSSQIGKYKEDKAVDFTGQDSRQHSRSTTTTNSASPLRAKPSGKGKTQLGFAQTWAEVARQMVCQRATIADHLAERTKSTYFVSNEEARKRCGEAVDSFTRVFAAIDYPFDLSSTVLGWEFCENVKGVVEESRGEFPRPPKWELCERVLDRCDKSWDETQEYADVGLPCWPPDFNDHINDLFEREKNHLPK